MRWFLDDLRIQVVGVLLVGVGLLLLVTALSNADPGRAGLGVLLTGVGALPVALRLWDNARRRRAALRTVPTALPPDPAWNHDSAEEFQVRGKAFSRALAPMAPLFLMFGAVMTLLGSIPFGLYPGVAVGVLCAVGLVVWFHAKITRGAQTTKVRMSPAGVELWDDTGTHIRVAWNAVTSVGPVNTAMVDPRQRVPTGVGRGGGMGVDQLCGSGVIGWGEHAMPARSPVWALERIAAQPRHPRTGAQQVAIPLGQVDPAWATGAMGGWIQRYRPDLMDQAAG